MTKEQLMRLLAANGVNSDIVCFDDVVKDDIFCVRKNYHVWEVFYREGEKNTI